MTVSRRALLSGLAAALAAESPARAEETPRRGGILRVYHPDSPASMSIVEETTISVIAPMTGVFNNLMVYDPHVERNSLDSILPDLASEWSWSDGGKQLDLTLRLDVAWHDGAPFSAADVVYTWNLVMGRGTEKLRLNPRQPWWANVRDVVATDDAHVSFRLARPQPSLLNMMASSGSPVYPKHIPAHEMRVNPIGTGPFRFAEYRRGETIRVERNPNYWKPDRPFLDGIAWSIVPNRSTAILGFVSDKYDMTFPASISLPLLNDLQSQRPDALCRIAPTNVAGNVAINRTVPPFDDSRLRRAVALALDRPAFSRIMTDGQALFGGLMLPRPYGVWGLPPEVLATMPLFDPDVEKRRAEARRIMAALGYGPDNHLSIVVSARNLPAYRDPAVVLIDQLRTVWIDGTLETVDTAVWDAKMTRRNFAIAFNQTGSSVDDPDQQLFENYACASARNFPGYCNPELEKQFVAQSVETDPAKRLRMVWDIDKALQEDVARPIAYHNVSATCWHPRVHGLPTIANSLYNGWRMEDVWLDA